MEDQLIEKDLLGGAINYNEYLEIFQKNSEMVEVSNLTDDEKDKLSNAKINFQRVSRIHRTYKASDSIQRLIAKIVNKQVWILITENWCGDSAQNVPYIVEIAKLNPLIEMKIMLRDQNPEFMDLYLTNGTRSIPKLIAFDKDGTELFQWGSRPKEAQELVTRLKAEGKTKTEFLEQLHLWYGRNRGKALETEIVQILNSL